MSECSTLLDEGAGGCYDHVSEQLSESAYEVTGAPSKWLTQVVPLGLVQFLLQAGSAAGEGSEGIGSVRCWRSSSHHLSKRTRRVGVFLSVDRGRTCKIH